MRKILPLSKLFAKTPDCSQKTSSSHLASLYASGRARRRINAVITIPYLLPPYINKISLILHVLSLVLLVFSSFSVLLICVLALLLLLSFYWVYAEICWSNDVSELSFDRRGWTLLLRSGERIELSIPNHFAVRPFVTSALIILPVQYRTACEQITLVRIFRRIYPRSLFFCSLWVNQEDLRILRVLLLSPSIIAFEREPL